MDDNTVLVGRKILTGYATQEVVIQHFVLTAFCLQTPIRGQGAGKGTSSMEVFQSFGFRDWKKAMGKKRGMLFCHDTSDIHKEATVKVMSFKSVTTHLLTAIRYIPQKCSREERDVIVYYRCSCRPCSEKHSFSGS